MAIVKALHVLSRCGNAWFERELAAGDAAPWTGIYQCLACGAEVIAGENQPLPADCSHLQRHPQRAIGWRLLVIAEDRPH